MMESQLPIGILDSGFGGLSVMRAVHAALPHERLIYAADCGFAPWGDRTDDYINARVDAVVNFLVFQGIKALVVACNTATAVAVARLRSSLPIPVVGIEPAVFPAVRETQAGKAGVLATVKTIASGKYCRLKAQALAWAAENRPMPVEIIDAPCPGLMECVERGEFHSPATRALVERYVRPIALAGADRLVLGCTHYPFLAEEIARAAGPQIKLIDPAPAVARQLGRRLDETGARRGSGLGACTFYATDPTDARERVLKTLWNDSAVLRPLA